MKKIFLFFGMFVIAATCLATYPYIYIKNIKIEIKDLKIQFETASSPTGISGWEIVGYLPIDDIFIPSVMSNKIHLLRSASAEASSRDFYEYDGTTNFTQLTNAPGDINYKSFGIGSLVFQDCFYSIGGNAGSPPVGLTNVYRFNGSVWEEISGFSTSTYSRRSVAILGSNLYVIGYSLGPTGGGTNVYRFDGTSWTEIPGIPVNGEGPQGGRIAQFGDYIYCLGRTNLWRYDGTTFENILGLYPVDTLFSPSGSLVAFANKLWWQSCNAVSSSTNCWFTDLTNWYPAPNAGSNVANYNYRVVFQDHIYQFGDGTNRSVIFKSINLPAD